MNALPFRSARDEDGEVHLVVLSPAIVGSLPGVLPGRSLCDRPVVEFSDKRAGEVPCEGCLHWAPMLMHLPAYGGVVV